MCVCVCVSVCKRAHVCEWIVCLRLWFVRECGFCVCLCEDCIITSMVCLYVFSVFVQSACVYICADMHSVLSVCVLSVCAYYVCLVCVCLHDIYMCVCLFSLCLHCVYLLWVSLL